MYKILNRAVNSLQREADRGEDFCQGFDPLSQADAASLGYSWGGFFLSFNSSTAIEI
jgi:hypothetical protein